VKRSLYLFSFLLAGSLYANDYDCCCYDPCDCCEVDCCEEYEPNLVEYRCYTPPFYDNSCVCGRALQGDVLYWYAKEMHLPYALMIEVEPSNQNDPPTLAFAPEEYSYMGTKWQPGFRFGTGWTSERDGWDGLATWTYFRSKKSSDEEVPQFGTLPMEPGEQALMNPWINPVASSMFTGQATILFNEIDAHWKLYFNQVDLEIARKYWISKGCTLRPYGGVRVAWTKSEFETFSYLNFGDPIFETDALISFQDKFTTHTLGGGLIGGFEPSWLFGGCCGFFGNVEFALLWQRDKTRKKEDYTSDNQEEVPFVSYTNKTSDIRYVMQSVLDLAAGVRWDFTWCCGRIHTTIDIGWEQHIWFDYNQLHTVADTWTLQGQGQSGFRTYDQMVSNLVLGGGFARLRLSF